MSKTLTKAQAKKALSKPLSEITDEELADLLTVPEQFLPEVEGAPTANDLVVEKVRRDEARRPSTVDVIAAAESCTLLRQMIGMGEGLYPWIDKIGRYQLREELKRRESVFNELFGRWSAK